MYFFTSIVALGIALLLIAHSNFKTKNIQTEHTFKIKYLYDCIFFIETEVLSKIQFIDGFVMITCGLLGLVFYDLLGLPMVFVTISLIIYYLINLFKNSQKSK